jgi:hypothetical protein
MNKIGQEFRKEQAGNDNKNAIKKIVQDRLDLVCSRIRGYLQRIITKRFSECCEVRGSGYAPNPAGEANLRTELDAAELFLLIESEIWEQFPIEMKSADINFASALVKEFQKQLQYFNNHGLSQAIIEEAKDASPSFISRLTMVTELENEIDGMKKDLEELISQIGLVYAVDEQTVFVNAEYKLPRHLARALKRLVGDTSQEESNAANTNEFVRDDDRAWDSPKVLHMPTEEDYEAFIEAIHRQYRYAVDDICGLIVDCYLYQVFYITVILKRNIEVFFVDLKRTAINDKRIRQELLAYIKGEKLDEVREKAKKSEFLKMLQEEWNSIN